jgi:arylformamidase
MVANTGTYLDTPYRRYPDGFDLTGLKLDAISHLPGVVVRLLGADERAIDWTAFAATDVRGKAVLLHTGWSRHWRTDQYFEGHPFLTEAAAVYLRDQGAVLVGIDSLNIDDTANGSRPVHSVLLAAGIPIVEHMTALEQVPIDGFTFTAAPPKIKCMGTFPVRAHARLARTAKPESEGVPTAPGLHSVSGRPMQPSPFPQQGSSPKLTSAKAAALRA